MHAMLSKRHRLASLALCCFQAAHIIAKPTLPSRLTHAADQGEEGVTDSQQPSSSGRIGSLIVDISDPQPAALPVAEKDREALDKEFNRLRDDLSMFKEAIRKFPMNWIDTTNQRILEIQKECVERILWIRQNLQELENICQLIGLCRQDRLFKVTKKRFVLAPHPPPLDELLETFYKGMRLNQPYKPNWSFTKAIRKLSANEKRLYAGSGNFLEGTAPEPGKMSGHVLDEVIDRVTSGWLKTLNELLLKITLLSDTAERPPNISWYDYDREAADVLLFQELLFRTAELLYKSEMIPKAHLNEFLKLKST
ncbi:hypothetical protein PTTG_27647 [Puccinia triticina 1-1 BBBD Race 1]|uniref:Uncharacterized protein n=1 Tax=Puccinia triticina (isolate 1-1 / race 1 (BBBD)) TaxID=630390 RepID=A0A180GIC5_PUCT1|nr:hypothetical protein PTTG_27647 [Puccinia triticina 1-1 BBBD Race 1]